MDEDVPILSVEEKGGLDLEEIRVVLDQELASSFIGSARQLIIKLHQFRGVQVINSKPLVHGRLYCVGDPLQTASQLVLQTGQAGVEQCGIEHHLIEEHCPNLVESCLQSGEVAAEVLNHFEETTHVFFYFEQLRFQLVDLDPVEHSQSHGRDGHT